MEQFEWRASDGVIFAVYRVKGFGGTKSMILSTTSILGAKNPFLGYAYITVGSLCLLVGVMFLIIHIKYGKRYDVNSILSSPSMNYYWQWSWNFQYGGGGECDAYYVLSMKSKRKYGNNRISRYWFLETPRKCMQYTGDPFELHKVSRDLWVVCTHTITFLHAIIVAIVLLLMKRFRFIFSSDFPFSNIMRKYCQGEKKCLINCTELAS